MAGDRPSPVVQRRRLRTELRKARQDAGLTQEQVADAMDWSLSKVIRIEAGTVGISTNDLKALLRHYQLDDPDRDKRARGAGACGPGTFVVERLPGRRAARASAAHRV